MILKIAMTYGLLFFALVAVGVATTRNDGLQEILVPVAVGWLLIGIACAIVYVWVSN